jgi:hypothetical protein
MIDIASTHDIAYLAQHAGGFFALPRGRTKGQDANGLPTFETGWQSNPHEAPEAFLHARAGNNVGYLTGKFGGIIVIDIDRDYPAVVDSLGPYARTVKIKRSNALDRGKLVFRASFPVATQSWTPEGWVPPQGEKRSPWAELLSDGRHALFHGEYDGGQYFLEDKEFGIAELTDDDLALVWYKVTIGRSGLPEPVLVQEKRQRATTEKTQDASKDLILDAWSTFDVFDYHARATEAKEEKNGEVRLLGNGGLLIKANGEGWYCFADDKGGGDSISAWAYCTRRSPSLVGRAYWDVLKEMAAAKGIPLLDTRANIFTNGNGYSHATQHGERFVDSDGVIHDEEPEEHHPLDIEPQAGLNLGWIDEYADFMTKLTVSPPEFNQLAGLVLAATAIQRRARLRMSFGDIYPNIYAAFVAQSSVYHKSSSTAKARQMMQRAMLDNLLLSELMTSEGLLKQLQDKPAGLVIRDEIGTLFASHNTKYLANLKPDLTALYDGYPYSRRLSNEEIKVQAPYLNILGATTPARFFEGVTFTDWQDGFLARWLFVMPDTEPDFDAMTGLFTTDHDARMGQLAIKLMQIDREPVRDFTLTDDALEMWYAWQRKATKEAYYYGDDVTAAIVTRYAAYALKFSIILTAINGKWGLIAKDTMATSMALADNYKATVYKLLTEKTNYGVSGAKVQKVFEVIRRYGPEGVSTKTIYQAANMKRGEAQPILEKLIEIGAVSTEKNGRGMRYTAAVERIPVKSW